MRTTIISLGGSIMVPNRVNAAFLKRFRNVVLSFVKKGNSVILVCGGGATSRAYVNAAKAMGKTSQEDLHWIGIRATVLNAELLRTLFGKEAYGTVLMNPTKRIKTGKRILIAAGWKPGWSTDYDAVLWAKTFKAKRVINLSNVGYVYDKDPSKHKNAKRIERISWKEFRKMFSGSWKPSDHAPFDPVASRAATRLGLKVVIAKGTDLRNLQNVLGNRPFKGTVIA